MEHADLVGRREERMLLEALIARRGSAVIAGPPGVGKTRLAREILSAVRSAGKNAVWVTATESSRAIPFGALSPLLKGDALDSGSSRSPASAMPASVSTGDDRPDLVVIDDGHLLDDASATLVLQLVGASDSSVLLTLTLGLEPPDAITATWKDGAAHRIDLQPLSRAETDALVAESLGGSCSALTLEHVWLTTQGNPLYVRELLDAGCSSGRLSLRRGRWHLDSDGDGSRQLFGLVASRIARLDSRVRRVLEVVALSAPVSLRLLESVVSLEAIAAAEEAGLVEVVADRDRTVARAMHPMHAEAARAVLPGARRRALCRELANALEAIGLRRRHDLLRFLMWRLDAGEHAPVELLLRGAWQAGEALDMRLAERLARAAVAGAPQDHAARLALADAIYRQARHRDALDVLARSNPESDRERTEIVIARAKATWGLGRLEEAELIVLEAAATIRDRDCLGWLQGFRATLRAALGFPMESVALAQIVVDDESYGARTTLSGLGSLALALAFSGRSADAIAAAQRGTDPELIARAESRTLLSWVEPALWTAAWLSGDIARAHKLADAYRASGLETNDAERVAGGSMGTGWATLMSGDCGAALVRLEEAIAFAPADDRIGIKTIALIGTGWAHAWRGDTTAATSALDEADAASRTGARWFAPCATIGRAWVAATDGDEREARRLFESAADESERRGLLPYALFALHGLARFDRARLASQRLAGIVPRVDGPFAPNILAHAEAIATQDSTALAGCSERFEELGMWLLAAECAAAEARACDEQGNTSRAEAARTRRDALARRIGEIHPVTLERLNTESPLTPREQQIARLAAGGSANRDIAEKLNLSVRTIDSHLAHIYTKLGIRSRHELAAALRNA